jgi:hypothetical protein
MRALIFFPNMARRPLLITMIISGPKLSATPINAGRSSRSHTGKSPALQAADLAPLISSNSCGKW